MDETGKGFKVGDIVRLKEGRHIGATMLPGVYLRAGYEYKICLSTAEGDAIIEFPGIPSLMLHLSFPARMENPLEKVG